MSTARTGGEILHCTMLASEFIDCSCHFTSLTEFLISLGMSESYHFFLYTTCMSLLGKLAVSVCIRNLQHICYVYAGLYVEMVSRVSLTKLPPCLRECYGIIEVRSIAKLRKKVTTYISNKSSG